MKFVVFLRIFLKFHRISPWGPWCEWDESLRFSSTIVCTSQRAQWEVTEWSLIMYPLFPSFSRDASSTWSFDEFSVKFRGNFYLLGMTSFSDLGPSAGLLSTFATSDRWAFREAKSMIICCTPIWIYQYDVMIWYHKVSHRHITKRFSRNFWEKSEKFLRKICKLLTSEMSLHLYIFSISRSGNDLYFSAKIHTPATSRHDISHPELIAKIPVVFDVVQPGAVYRHDLFDNLSYVINVFTLVLLFFRTPPLHSTTAQIIESITSFQNEKFDYHGFPDFWKFEERSEENSQKIRPLEKRGWTTVVSSWRRVAAPVVLPKASPFYLYYYRQPFTLVSENHHVKCSEYFSTKFRWIFWEI